MEVPTLFHRIRFGKFEVDPESGELFKDGRLIRLQGQPIQILLMLLEKPGKLVTREELQHRLWPTDTFVDFDRGLNAAIKRLRESLSDSADEPRYIETLPRRGYRFIFPVEGIPMDAPRPVPNPPPSWILRLWSSMTQSPASLPNAEENMPEAVQIEAPAEQVVPEIHPREPGEAAAGRILPRWNAKRWISVTALLAVLIVPFYWYISRQNSEVIREPMRIVPFTTLPGMEVNPKFSPDGKFVAFQWNGPARDNWDIYVKQVGGEGQLRLTSDPAYDGRPVWSPDGGEIAFVRVSAEVTSIYTVPSLSGAERKLYELRAPSGASYLSWSPDGHWLAFSEKSAAESPARIFLLSLDTRQKIPLTSPPPGTGGDFSPEFFPDGKRVAFVRQNGFLVTDIWVQPVSSGEATRLTYENYYEASRIEWTADGREVVFAARSGLFRVPLTGGVPQAVAGIGENAWDPSIWGNHMVFVQASAELNKIWRMRGPNYRGKDHSAAPILASTRSELNSDYSPDGKKLAFQSDRSGFSEIWTCDSDGGNSVQLTKLRRWSGDPRWSPDGKRIAFDCIPEEGSKIYVIDADGGIPQRLTNEKSRDENPSWSRDGRWVYFSSNRGGNYQVWKMPSEGGKAVQVTKGGGFYAVESFDGKILYYIKPGRRNYGFGPIWKVPREGGEETLVLDREVAWCTWALRPEGIYFSTYNGKKYLIELLSFQTGKVTLIYQEVTPNPRPFLTISPEGQWFLYNVWESKSDLMLVENFR